MTAEEFAKIGMAMKTYYPREQNLLKDENAIRLWYEALKDISYQTMYLALQKWVETERWSPSIADLRRLSYSITNGDVKTWDEAWEEVMQAIRYYGYNRRVEALDGFDEVTRKVVNRIGWMQLCMSEQIAIERAAFRDIYRVLSDKTVTEGQIAPAVKKVIEATRQAHRRVLEDKPKDNAPTHKEADTGDPAMSERVQELLKRTKERLEVVE